MQFAQVVGGFRLPFREVGVAEFVGAVADVERCVALGKLVSVIRLDLFAGAVDAFTSDVADFAVAGFVGFTFFISRFGSLYLDVLTTAAIFGVELHDGVGSCAGAGEEVENHVVVTCN